MSSGELGPAEFLATGQEVLAQMACSRPLGAELTALAGGHCTPELPGKHDRAPGGLVSQ